MTEGVIPSDPPTPPTPSPDPADPEAWGRAVEALRPYLEWLARRELANKPAHGLSVSDIVQEAISQALASRNTFRGSTTDEPRAFVRIILLRVILLHRRRSRGARIVPAEGSRDSNVARAVIDPRTPPLRAASRDESLRALAAALPKLSPEHRRVVELRHVEGLRFEAIGRELGCSAEAARKLWKRALAKLKDFLGPGHDSGSELPSSPH